MILENNKLNEIVARIETLIPDDIGDITSTDIASVRYYQGAITDAMAANIVSAEGVTVFVQLGDREKTIEEMQSRQDVRYSLGFSFLLVIPKIDGNYEPSRNSTGTIVDASPQGRLAIVEEKIYDLFEQHAFMRLVTTTTNRFEEINEIMSMRSDWVYEELALPQTF